MDWASWHAAYDATPGQPGGRPRPQVRAWFTQGGFEDVAFDALETTVMIGVGVCRVVRVPAARLPDERLFTFRSSA